MLDIVIDTIIMRPYVFGFCSISFCLRTTCGLAKDAYLYCYWLLNCIRLGETFDYHRVSLWLVLLY